MDNGQDHERDSTGEQPKADAGHRHDSVYYYKDSGIHEQHGYVPLWLWAVAVSLVIWGTYYLIENWSPPT